MCLRESPSKIISFSSLINFLIVFLNLLYISHTILQHRLISDSLIPYSLCAIILPIINANVLAYKRRFLDFFLHFSEWEKSENCKMQSSNTLIYNSDCLVCVQSSRPICVIRNSMWVKSERTAGRKVRSLHVLSLLLSLSLPFNIIDSDCCTVRFWLLPLLHDSRLRTCFPRYDKQHDASDACNVADIMHICRWYGTKRQDVFSNVAITIEVDARGKARQGEGCEYWSRTRETRASYVPSVQKP